MSKKRTDHHAGDELEKVKRLEAFLRHRSVFLTRKELHVLYGAIKGQTNAETADALGVTIATVKTHKNNLISKLGVEGKDGFRKLLLKMAQSQP